MLIAIACEGGVSVEWLATGQGSRDRDPDSAPRPERQPRRKAVTRTGLYEPDEDPAYQRWPIDVSVFHAIINAADTVGAELARGDRTEIARWMYLAIDIMTLAPDNRLRLDEGDMQALARIVRKLIFTDENGG